MIVGVLPLFACFVLLVLFYYISAWQRPGTLPTVSAEPAKRAGSFLTRAYHWVTTNLYNYAGPGLLGKLVHGPGLALLKYIEKITQAALSNTIVSHLSLATRWLRTFEAITTGAWLNLGYLAQETHDALYALRHVTVPALIRAAVAPVAKIANEAQTIANKAETTITDFQKALLASLAAVGIGSFTTLQQGINAFVKAFGNLHTEVWQHIRPIVLNMQTVVIPGIIRGLGDLEKEIFQGIPGTLGALRQWVQELEDFAANALRDPTAWILGLLGSAAGILGLTAILAKIAPDLFCNNTKNVTKKLCGLDTALLDAILGLSLAFLVVIDPVAIAEAALATEDAMEPVIRQVAS